MMTSNTKTIAMALAAGGLGYVLWKSHKGREAQEAMGEAASNVADNIADEVEDVEDVAENPSGRSLFYDIRKSLKRPEGKALVPATFLAFGLLDAVPIPTDIGYFYTEKWLLDNKDKLSPRKYWLLQYFNYYGWDVAWYLSLFLLTYYGGEDVEDKLKIGAALISSGAIATMLWNFSRQPQPQTQPAMAA